MAQQGTKIKRTKSTKAVKIISYTVIALFSLICLLPFILIISASLSTEGVIAKEGFGILPKGLTLSAYMWVFRYPKMIIGSYVVTILMTVFGTIVGLLIISMTGYALQRKDFPFRNAISFFIYFTTLFSAGMAPTFIWISRYLNLRGSYYQKELEIPGILLSQRIVLRFGSVTHEAKVYLNGELICRHKGGFLPFEVEITDHIISGKNLLCVAVDNKVDRYGQDHYTQKFGIRTVKTEGDRFLINGKPFYFKGFGKHEDSAFHGRGPDEVLNVKDLSIMHWLHANSFRTSHYPYSEEMMNLCDEEGIVVIDEVPAVGLSVDEYERDPIGFEKYNAEHHREVIRDLIRRDKNHPCVVMWSIANEPNTEAQPQAAYDYFKPLYDLAHEQDPQNRPVTLVVCQNDYVKDLTAPAMDVICLNRYYGWYLYGGDLILAQKAFACEMEYWKKTGKPVMLTEYGADTVAGLHNTVPGMFSEEYQMEYYQAMNEVLDNCSFVVGEQLWNFADFATVQGLMRVDGNKKGILTRDRRPKMAAHYCRNRWKEIPDFHS